MINKFAKLIIVIGACGFFIGNNKALSKTEESLTASFNDCLKDAFFYYGEDVKICKIEGCNNKHKAKGLCLKHYHKQYYQANKEHLLEIQKQWQKNNKEYRAKLKKQYYLDNKEKILKQQKQYYQTPAGKASIKASWHNHKMLTKDLKTAIIQRVYEANIAKYGVLTCYLCGNPIVFGDNNLKDSIDHSTPVTREGSNNYENLGIAHLSCNMKKFTKTLDEWFNKGQ